MIYHSYYVTYVLSPWGITHTKQEKKVFNVILKRGKILHLNDSIWSQSKTHPSEYWPNKVIRCVLNTWLFNPMAVLTMHKFPVGDP